MWNVLKKKTVVLRMLKMVSVKMINLDRPISQDIQILLLNNGRDNLEEKL